MFKMDASSGCQVHSEWNSLKWKKKVLRHSICPVHVHIPDVYRFSHKTGEEHLECRGVCVCVCVCDGGECGWTGVCFKIYQTLKLKHNVTRKIPKQDICSLG